MLENLDFYFPIHCSEFPHLRLADHVQFCPSSFPSSRLVFQSSLLHSKVKTSPYIEYLLVSAPLFLQVCKLKLCCMKSDLFSHFLNVRMNFNMPTDACREEALGCQSTAPSDLGGETAGTSAPGTDCVNTPKCSRHANCPNGCVHRGAHAC